MLKRRIKTMFVNGVLLVGLVGLLVVYRVVVNDLPARIYTKTQQEYLNYNDIRSVSQVAPTWNVIQSDGQLLPTLLPGQKSRVRATLTARHEQQEGVSVPIYDLDFRGEYYLAHSDPMATTVELFFPFPGNLETLHQVRFLVDGEEPPEAHYSTQGINWRTVLQPGEERRIVISYRANGANSFAYGLHHNQRSDVDVCVVVEGLVGSEVSENSLRPTASEVRDGGQVFAWNYTGLIADRDVQLALPPRLSYAQRVAQSQDDFRALATWAPSLVGSFLVSLAGVFYLGGLRLPTESCLLTGWGLALFYPTLTFLSGVVSVTLAAVLAVLLVVGLLSFFLGLMVGWRQTWRRAGPLLIIFLGLFSLGMLTPWRGLLLTGGGLLLVGFFMLFYARRPAVPEPGPAPPLDGTAPPPGEMNPKAAHLFCPYCARALAEDDRFCSGCGQDASCFRRCDDCGRQQLVSAESETAYCIHCGRSLNLPSRRSRLTRFCAEKTQPVG